MFHTLHLIIIPFTFIILYNLWIFNVIIIHLVIMFYKQFILILFKFILHHFIFIIYIIQVIVIINQI